MKKILALLFTASMILAANNAYAQLSVGAGYNNPVFRNSHSSDALRLNGFYAGASYTLPLIGSLKVSPGLYYSFSAANRIDSGKIFSATLSLKSDLAEHYIDIPVMLSYGIRIIPDVKFFAFGGPTLSVGLSSTSGSSVSINIPGSPINGSSKDDNYSEIFSYNRMNLLLGGGLGAELLDHYRVQVSYNFGLLNRSSLGGDYVLLNNRLLVGVAYVF